MLSLSYACNREETCGGGSMDTPSLIPGISAGGLNVLRPGLLLLTRAYSPTLQFNLYIYFFPVPASSGNVRISWEVWEMLSALQRSEIRTLGTLRTTSNLNPVLTRRNLFTCRLGSHWPTGADCNCVSKNVLFCIPQQHDNWNSNLT